MVDFAAACARVASIARGVGVLRKPPHGRQSRHAAAKTAPHPQPEPTAIPRRESAASACAGSRDRPSRVDRVPAPRRNVELKARDPDPERTLRLALALGAEDRGDVDQRDTYFAVRRGRLKLREERPGGAWLVGYARADAADARTSAYRLVEVPDPEGLRAALDEALGVRAVVVKRRRLLLWEGVRIHLDEVEGLGRFVELEALADEGSDLAREHALVARLRTELGLADEDLVAGSYADLVAGDAEALIAAAHAAMRNAHAPYSGFPVGAALRSPDGAIHVGANVENAAYPQGQCAEASAIGALVAAGEREIAAIAVVAGRLDACPPCGGCRQRLSEFGRPETPVHLGRPGGPVTTVTLGELLPLSFGRESLA
jgi:homotetrameric cytidine deaminase